MGTMTYRVRDDTENPLPVRLVLRGLASTKDPNFGADGPAWGVANMAYSLTGTGTLALAPGRYRVLVVHGPEFSWAVQDVTITAGKATVLDAHLVRQVHSTNAISADLHLHASPSHDSAASLADRIIQLAAEGIEAAAATDHNAVTDYGPTAKALSLPVPMVLMRGCEVTTSRAMWGHFNIFPLPKSTKAPAYRNQKPSDMFRRWHQIPGNPIVQVNHPRLTYLGYMNQVDYDPRFGKAFASGFSKNYDAIEVFNGTRMFAPKRLDRALRDWYSLLNLGDRVTATGNSDSHKLAFQEAGYPRNDIIVGRNDPTKVTPKQIAAALRRHAVVVTSGPSIAVERPVTKGLGPADKSVIGTQLKGPVNLDVLVQAACWLPVTKLRLIANGRVVRTWTLSKDRAVEDANPSPDVSLPVPAASPLARLDRPTGALTSCRGQHVTVHLHLAPNSDTWYVLQAIGSFDNPTLIRRGGIDVAFTNPVWIDADGDGRFKAPGIVPPPTR